MDQYVFTENGDILIEKLDNLVETTEKVDDEAPEIIKNAWRKAKQDKIKEFKKKQALSYEEKLERQKEIAWEYYTRLQGMGMNAHVSVGGLDSITLYVWLLSIGIDVPAISVSGIEDSTIQKVHKALGITKVAPYKSKIQVLREFGFPVISKKIAGRISTERFGNMRTAPGTRPRHRGPDAACVASGSIWKSARTGSTGSGRQTRRNGNSSCTGAARTARGIPTDGERCLIISA